MDTIEFSLPFPPSVNHYYVQARHHSGKYISAKGSQFRKLVSDSIHEQVPGVCVSTPMLLEVVLYMPDKRERDLDNYQKALLDAITHAGLWTSDSLIDQLFIYRGVSKTRGGSVFVRITPAGPVLPDGMRP